MNHSPAYLDLKALAQDTCLSIRTWREILKSPNAPPSIRVGGGKILVAKTDVDAYFQGLKESPGDGVGEIVDEVMEGLTGKQRKVRHG